MVMHRNGCKIALVYSTVLVIIWLVDAQKEPENLKVKLCSKRYKYTAFPNVFGHKSQDEAIRHMHTFMPLQETFCSDQLFFFMCLTHFPAYGSIESQTSTPPCRSLCQNVMNRCNYTIDRLKFHWPDAISCDKFPDKVCYVTDAPSETTPTPGCETASRIPICSAVKVLGSKDQQFFEQVNKSFTNYFKHSTQDIAVYELSKHFKLVNLLIVLQNKPGHTDVARKCLNALRYLLCVLHLPHCGREQYLITKTRCKETFKTHCDNAIALLRDEGYDVKWPPVPVNCNDFRDDLTQDEKTMQYDFKNDTFGGFYPPPPAVKSTINGSDFIELKWKTFPPEFNAGLEVLTEILYKETGTQTSYNHYHPERGETQTLVFNLKKDAVYDVLVGTSNNETLLPGTLAQLQFHTGTQIELVRSTFCSPFYGVTGSFPNIFGDLNRTNAMFHMHTFFPLLDTGCSPELRALMCSAFLPRYNSDTSVAEKPCQSLCQSVFAKCVDEIANLNFKWPNELTCTKLPSNSPCYNFSGAINPARRISGPPTIGYKTLNSTSITVEWQTGFSNDVSAEILYKPKSSKETYTHVHVHLRPGSRSLTIPGITPQNYHVFVGFLDVAREIPGRLENITYVHGTTVYDITPELGLCHLFYKKTILPNRFGDRSIEQAKTRLSSFFPLVYTLCSDEITPFLCSVFLPRFHTRYLPCRSVCQRIYNSCSYAMKRSRFYWPAELNCDTFENGGNCYDITEFFTPTGQVLLPIRQFLRPQRAVKPCTMVKPNLICSQVSSEVTNSKYYFETMIDFKSGQKNYFDHKSKEEAVYELSKFLPLLSTLSWERNNNNFTQCAKDLIILLCHLHLPVCSYNVNPKLVGQNECSRILNTGSPCHAAIAELQNQHADFKWPPVNVDCTNTDWFGNSSQEGVSVTISHESIPPPPPKILKVEYKDSSSISIGFTEAKDENVVFPTGALFRKNNTITEYIVQNTGISYLEGQNSAVFTLRNLDPGQSYEINLASLYSINGFPGLYTTMTDKIYGRCPNDTTGEAVTQGHFFWLAQGHEGISEVNCPYGIDVDGLTRHENEYDDGAQPNRRCHCNDTACVWGVPRNTDVCKYKTFNNTPSRELTDLLQSLIKNPELSVNASKTLVNLTTNVTKFQEHDIILTVEILDQLVNNEKDVKQSGPNIVKTVNNILNIADDILIKSQVISKTSSRMLEILDKYLDTVPIGAGENLIQNEINLAVSSQEFNGTNFEGAAAVSLQQMEKTEVESNFVVYHNDFSVEPQTSQVSLTLPKSIFESLSIDNKKKSQRINFVIYRKTSLFQSLKNLTSLDTKTVRKKNSYVISGAVRGYRLKNLKDPVVSTYYPLEDAVDKSTACVFWEFEKDNGLGGWSEVGCSYQGSTDQLITCHCNHLTNFAILMDIYIEDHNSEVHNKALSYISYIGCAISLLGLILTIITILIFKDLRSKAPTQILLNFCLALGFTLIVFLTAAERSKTASLTACRAAAIALHYFVLVTFAWMAISAFNMYQAFVKVIPKHRSHFLLKCCFVGWGLPIIIVVITAAVAIDEYGDETFCRVTGLPFQLAFLAPVLVILVGNSIAFVLILHSLLTSRRNITADRRISGLTQARRGAAILVVLGLTWLFGIMAVKDAKLVFQYLFCIFNSIQGLLVFILYCVFSSDTREKYKKLFCGKKKGKDSESGYKAYGLSGDTGALTRSSGSPNNSTNPSSGTFSNNPESAIQLHPTRI